MLSVHKTLTVPSVDRVGNFKKGFHYNVKEAPKLLRCLNEISTGKVLIRSAEYGIVYVEQNVLKESDLS